MSKITMKKHTITTLEDLYNEFIKGCKFKNLWLTTLAYYADCYKTLCERQQIIPLSPTLCKILTEYLQYRGGDGNDYLFPTDENLQMLPDGITTAIKRYNHSSGVSYTSVHAFRHYFAKQCVLNGVDIFTLQRQGG